MTEVRSRWLDASGAGVAGRVVYAKLVAPSGFLLDDSGEAIERAVTTTADGTGADPIGFWKLNLTPQASLAATDSYYRIVEGSRVHYCVVPTVGPVQLSNILVDPDTLNPTEPAASSLYVPQSLLGMPSGVATLGSDGILTAGQRPAGGGGGGAVDSVDGRIGVVTLGDLYVDPTELNAGLSGKENTGVAAGLVTGHAAAADPHPNYLTTAEANVAYAALAHKHHWDRLLDALGLCGATGHPLHFGASATPSNNDHLIVLLSVTPGEQISGFRVAVMQNATSYAANATPAQLKAYDIAGTLLGTTPDSSTLWLTSGVRDANLAAAITAPANGLMFVGASFGGYVDAKPAIPPGNLATSILEQLLAGGQRFAIYASSGTGLPNSFNPSTYGVGTSWAPWIGVKKA